MKTLARLSALVVVTCLIVNTVSPAVAAQRNMSPVLPAVASFVLPGSGQLINDEPNKALVHFVVGIALYSAHPLTWESSYYSLVPALNLAWSGYSAYDAYRVAEGRRRGIFDSSLELEEPESNSLDTVDLDLTDRGSSSEFSVSRISG